MPFDFEHRKLYRIDVICRYGPNHNKENAYYKQSHGIRSGDDGIQSKMNPDRADFSLVNGILQGGLCGAPHNLP